MKLTKDINEVKPSRRSEMLVDAYKHFAERVKLLALEVEIHNRWLDILPSQISEGLPAPDTDKLLKLIGEFENQWDELAAQVIDNGAKLNHFLEAVAFYQKYGEIKPTIQE
jgi:hypothetical protein